jgi:hypothetical protein
VRIKSSEQFVDCSMHIASLRICMRVEVLSSLSIVKHISDSEVFGIRVEAVGILSIDIHRSQLEILPLQRTWITR